MQDVVDQIVLHAHSRTRITVLILCMSLFDDGFLINQRNI